MNKKIAQSTDSLNSARLDDSSGFFITVVNGNLCRLAFSTQPDQRFSGSLKLNDESYEIRGVVTSPNLLYGFILEPFEHKPIAMLRAHIFGDEIYLELDMPEDTDSYSESPVTRGYMLNYIYTERCYG